MGDAQDYDIGAAFFLGMGYTSQTAHVLPTDKERKAIKRKKKFFGFVDFAKLKRDAARTKRKAKRKGKK